MESFKFDGSDYVPKRDDVRLSVQYLRIFELMKDGVYRTLLEIEQKTGDPQASISAQLRHMRKERFGSHVINKIYLGKGLYQYQLIVNAGGSNV
jgi:hypothetical protein